MQTSCGYSSLSRGYMTSMPYITISGSTVMERDELVTDKTIQEGTCNTTLDFSVFSQLHRAQPLHLTCCLARSPMALIRVAASTSAVVGFGAGRP